MLSLTKDHEGVYRQRISIDEHTIFSDVNASLGGEASAPDPHDLFDSALAACTAITLNMYAKRKKIPLESIDIQITRDNTQEKEGDYSLALDIAFIGNLSEEERAHLMTIVEKCPIHKLMSHGRIHINATEQKK